MDIDAATKHHKKCWFTVYTQARKEQKALEHLQRQGYTCFLPKIIQRPKRLGKRISREVALFPRYLFLQACQYTDNMAPIRSTRGVCDLVRFSLEPAVIPDHFIEQLQAKVADDGYVHLDAKRFKKGDKLRVSDGALDGAIGTLLDYSSEERVIMLIDLLGRETKVELAGEYLEAV
ncbi:MAG: transcription termination/antitermination NusG family protein [bacterium]